jgi:hypothetical protein
MSTLTPDDILANAKRAGWSITPARAAELAASANARISVFDRVRPDLVFEDEVAGFTAALIANQAQEAGQ